MSTTCATCGLIAEASFFKPATNVETAAEASRSLRPEEYTLHREWRQDSHAAKWSDISEAGQAKHQCKKTAQFNFASLKDPTTHPSQPKESHAKQPVTTESETSSNP